MNNIYELGSKLCELLSTLKKNREYVPLEILQTQYRVPYETLKKQIGDTATAFVKEITLSKLMINPNVSLEEQISVIQQTITTSGILKEMGYTLSKLYDVELLHRQALKLRTYIEDALYPYIALQDCLVVDMERIEDNHHIIDCFYHHLCQIIFHLRQVKQRGRKFQYHYPNPFFF